MKRLTLTNVFEIQNDAGVAWAINSLRESRVPDSKLIELQSNGRMEIFETTREKDITMKGTVVLEKADEIRRMTTNTVFDLATEGCLEFVLRALLVSGIDERLINKLRTNGVVDVTDSTYEVFGVTIKRKVVLEAGLKEG